MADSLKVTTTDGSSVEYIDDIIGKGAMKIAYFTPDKSSVVALYKEQQDAKTKDRLENIVGKYNPCNDPTYGAYWEKLFCWPTKIIGEGNMGIVLPAYHKHFFFEAGPMKGKEKEGKWFASAKLRKILDSSEKGDWLNYFLICIKISRAVSKMHSSGLAHSDLSYKNVLIDPKNGNAAIIDIDGLVVPGKYPPEVLGTADFIAPEVYKTRKLDLNDPKRIFPSIKTDLHALATLIYMYLLYRHPLRGKKVHDVDPSKDEEMLLGEKALFIEHPQDKSNRPPQKIEPAFLPWGNVSKIPYTVTGPYLKKLFDAAFINGLHDPTKRPIASNWESELIKTVDLLQPCENPKCNQKWFVFDNTTKPKCPFCGWEFKGLLPILNFYSSRKQGQYNPDNHRLMVYHNQYFYPWHVNKNIFPNEKLSKKDKKPVAYFAFHNGKWVMVNQNIPDMKDLTKNKPVPINSMVELENNKQILLSRESGGRMIFVQMVQA